MHLSSSQKCLQFRRSGTKDDGSYKAGNVKTSPEAKIRTSLELELV